jgi:hypothetical protein
VRGRCARGTQGKHFGIRDGCVLHGASMATFSKGAFRPIPSSLPPPPSRVERKSADQPRARQSSPSLAESASSSASVSRASGPGFRVDPVCPTVARVTLWGRLPLAWLGQLSAALSRRGIGIRDVRADREQDGSWQVVLELSAEEVRTAPHTQELSRIDYLALTEEPAPDASDPTRPRLASFYLGRDVESSLELQVRAKDELGFLSALFVRLGFLGLFPVKVRATTVGERIDDTFVLHGVGGAPPSSAAERALRTVLTRLARPPSQKPA